MTPPGPVVTLGEAIVALVPVDSASLVTTTALGLHVGGAELNVAVGISRLGHEVAWVGALGDDPMGRRVLDVLRAEDVGTHHIRVVPDRQTAVYLRSPIHAGEREINYYRAGSVATALEPDLWPHHLRGAAWLHLTGITAALGEQARALLSSALDWASAHGVPISFDPNYRRALWSADEAAPHLLGLARRADVTLLSEADARVMVGTAEPQEALRRLRQRGVGDVVLKRGGETVFAAVDDQAIAAPVVPVPNPADTVGAGDGFDAGFVAARLAGAEVEAAIEVGCFIGGRAVETVGEHCYPMLDELPPRLAEIVREPALAAARRPDSRSGQPNRQERTR